MCGEWPCCRSGRSRTRSGDFRRFVGESRDLSDARVEGFAAFNLARAYRIAGHPAEALEAVQAAADILGKIEAPETGAATALGRALAAERAGDRASQARALLECARHTVRTPDLFSPHDLVAEVIATAEAERLADVAAAARALRDELDVPASEPHGP
jgi:hypothetical protein